jgi:chloramphenicol 3-O-phosphotransferase
MASDDEPASPGAGDIIKVVGPCKSGKSTLVAGLQAAGYAARSCGQEHSETPAMWQRIHPPDCLVFLEVSLETMRARVNRSDWSDDLLATQQRRLAHARQHADLIVATDLASAQEVLGQVMAFLEQCGLRRMGG